MRSIILLLPAMLSAGSVRSQTPNTVHIAPPYVDAPAMTASVGQPQGTLRSFIMSSRDSRIYPGIRQLDNETTRRRDAYGNRLAASADQQSEAAPYRREVFVYVPAAYRPGTEAPLLVVQDGRDYAARVAAALDSLIAQHRVPAMVAVMIQSGGGDAQGRSAASNTTPCRGAMPSSSNAKCFPG